MGIQMYVLGVVAEDEYKAPVVILRAVEGDETLPIVIGVAEAMAIAAAHHGVKFPRPMTHDLLKSVIEHLGATLEKVEVVDLRDGTFYGALHLRRGNETTVLDCRPSDAIALALRFHAPIFVADTVFEKMQPEDATEASRQHWLNFLKALQDVQEGKEGDEDEKDEELVD